MIIPHWDQSTYALMFESSCSNNEVEYEALLAGLRLARNMIISKLQAFGDLMMVFNQIIGEYETKETHIKKYLTQVVSKSLRSPTSLGQKNKEVNALSKLALIVFNHLSKNMVVEVLLKRSIEGQAMEVFEVFEDGISCMTPYIRFLRLGVLLEDDKVACNIRTNPA